MILKELTHYLKISIKIIKLLKLKYQYFLLNIFYYNHIIIVEFLILYIRFER
jgi:hypothetical protein